MKKILFLSGSLLLLCSAIFVVTGNFQTLTSGFNIPVHGAGKFLTGLPQLYNFIPKNPYLSIDDVDFDGQNITILSKTHRLGLITQGTVAQIGSGNSYSPVIIKNQFDIVNNKVLAEAYPINLVDITGKTTPYSVIGATNLGTVVGTNETDPRLSVIQQKIPNAFPSDAGSASVWRDTLQVNYYFSSYTISACRLTKKLDQFSRELETYESKNVITPERVEFGGGEYKLFPWMVDFYNPKNNTVILPIGCNRKELKNQFYKEIAYVTYGSDGKILKQAIVKFDYTKDHEFISLADNAATGEKQLVAILGNRMYMGKQNDPAINTFTLLVLNPDGTQKLLKNFQYGLKPREFWPVFAFLNGDKTYVVSRNKLSATLETFVFDANGDFTIQKITRDELNGVTFGNKNAGMGFTAGASDYKMLSLYKLASGNIALIADDKYVESVPNPNATPGTMNQTMNIFRYKNLVAFEFTPAGECKGQYIIYKNFYGTLTPTYIENVIVKDNRIIILTLDKTKSILNPYLSALQNNTFISKGCKELCRPAVMDFNFANTSVNIAKPADPMFINLYGTGSYFLLNDNSGISYFGIKSDAQLQAEAQIQAKDPAPAPNFEFQVNTIIF
jgi:hypothetical protein